jgi:NAD(P)-dependent dehydrogenase (short-subunit alcohol dehydrogenase family)
MRCEMALVGKHALVTGGGSGIGAAIAMALAEAGANVTICGRRREPLEATAARHNNIAAEIADVTNDESIAQLYARAQTVRGAFDIVVPNAGSARSAPAEKITRELWMSTLHVNLTGAFLSVQPAIAGMRQRRWGRIIFIASTAGLKGYPYVAPYVAAKHGVVGLARALALETAKDGITANAVCPGYTASSPIPSAAKPTCAPRWRPTTRTDGLFSRKRLPTWCCGCARRKALRSLARPSRCQEASHGERAADLDRPRA